MEVSTPFVGDTMPREAVMDQPPADPNMSGQVVGEEIFGELGEIPDPSVAKDPEPK